MPRHARFDQTTPTDLLVTLGGMVVGVLLMALGPALRTVDDNLVDLD